MKDKFPPATQNPCGHQTKHTNRIGCCASCKHLFSSDSAFNRHRKGGKCLYPANSGLVAKRSKRFPDEWIWSLAPGDASWRESND